VERRKNVFRFVVEVVSTILAPFLLMWIFAAAVRVLSG